MYYTLKYIFIFISIGYVTTNPFKGGDNGKNKKNKRGQQLLFMQQPILQSQPVFVQPAQFQQPIQFQQPQYVPLPIAYESYEPYDHHTYDHPPYDHHTYDHPPFDHTYDHHTHHTHDVHIHQGPKYIKAIPVSHPHPHTHVVHKEEKDKKDKNSKNELRLSISGLSSDGSNPLVYGGGTTTKRRTSNFDSFRVNLTPNQASLSSTNPNGNNFQTSGNNPTRINEKNVRSNKHDDLVSKKQNLGHSSVLIHKSEEIVPKFQNGVEVFNPNYVENFRNNERLADNLHHLNNQQQTEETVHDTLLNHGEVVKSQNIDNFRQNGRFVDNLNHQNGIENKKTEEKVQNTLNNGHLLNGLKTNETIFETFPSKQFQIHIPSGTKNIKNTHRNTQDDQVSVLNDQVLQIQNHRHSSVHAPKNFRNERRFFKSQTEENYNKIGKAIDNLNPHHAMANEKSDKYISHENVLTGRKSKGQSVETFESKQIEIHLPIDVNNTVNTNGEEFIIQRNNKQGTKNFEANENFGHQQNVTVSNKVNGEVTTNFQSFRSRQIEFPFESENGNQSRFIRMNDINYIEIPYRNFEQYQRTPEEIDDGSYLQYEKPPQFISNHEYNFSPNHVKSRSNQGYGEEPIVHKHVYVHVPPKFPADQETQKPFIPQRPEKHYKIIFIKAPTVPTPTLPIIPPQAKKEEKTLVYVLVKKPEEQQPITLPTQEPTEPSKPEVFFIRYKNIHDKTNGIREEEEGYGGRIQQRNKNFKDNQELPHKDSKVHQKVDNDFFERKYNKFIGEREFEHNLNFRDASFIRAEEHNRANNEYFQTRERNSYTPTENPIKIDAYKSVERDYHFDPNLLTKVHLRENNEFHDNRYEGLSNKKENVHNANLRNENYPEGQHITKENQRGNSELYRETQERDSYNPIEFSKFETYKSLEKDHQFNDDYSRNGNGPFKYSLNHFSFNPDSLIRGEGH